MNKFLLPIIVTSSSILIASCGNSSSSSNGGTPAQYRISSYTAISNAIDYTGIWMLVQTGTSDISSVEVSNGRTVNSSSASGTVYRRALMLIQEVPGTSDITIDVCGENQDQYTVDGNNTISWDDGTTPVGTDSTTGNITFSDFANFAGTMTMTLTEIDTGGAIIVGDGETTNQDLNTTVEGVKLSNLTDLSFTQANTLNIISANAGGIGAYAGPSTDAIACFSEFEMKLNGSGITVDEQNPGGPNINFSIYATEGEVEVHTQSGHEINVSKSRFEASAAGAIAYRQTSVELNSDIAGFAALTFTDSEETGEATVDEISTNTLSTSITAVSGSLTASSGSDAVNLGIDLQL